MDDNFMKRFMKLEKLEPLPQFWKDKKNIECVSKNQSDFYGIYETMKAKGYINYKIIPLEHYWVIEIFDENKNNFINEAKI